MKMRPGCVFSRFSLHCLPVRRVPPGKEDASARTAPVHRCGEKGCVCVCVTVCWMAQGCEMRAPAAAPLGTKSEQKESPARGVGIGDTGDRRQSYERLPPPVKMHQVPCCAVSLSHERASEREEARECKGGRERARGA